MKSWINDFTGKKKTGRRKKMTHKGVEGVYLIKTDTTPEDPDYITLELNDTLIKNGFEMDNFVVVRLEEKTKL